MLEYINPFKDCTNIKPIIRVHSESIFDRFPLIEKIYKNRYRFSIQKIIENGRGYLLLFYRDGRGSGLGYYLIDHYMSGVKNDMRDEVIINVQGHKHRNKILVPWITTGIRFPIKPLAKIINNGH